jgi:hypothetical protein
MSAGRITATQHARVIRRSHAGIVEQVLETGEEPCGSVRCLRACPGRGTDRVRAEPAGDGHRGLGRPSRSVSSISSSTSEVRLVQCYIVRSSFRQLCWIIRSDDLRRGHRNRRRSGSEVERGWASSPSARVRSLLERSEGELQNSGLEV